MTWATNSFLCFHSAESLCQRCLRLRARRCWMCSYRETVKIVYAQTDDSRSRIDRAGLYTHTHSHISSDSALLLFWLPLIRIIYEIFSDVMLSCLSKLMTIRWASANAITFAGHFPFNTRVIFQFPLIDLYIQIHLLWLLSFRNFPYIYNLFRFVFVFFACAKNRSAITYYTNERPRRAHSETGL